MVVVGTDGMEPTAAINAAVVVVSVDSCATVDCGRHADSSLRIVIDHQMSGGTRWTIYAHFPGMPPDLVKAGDTLNFMFSLFEATRVPVISYGRSIILGRHGTPVMFAAQRADDLVSYGLSVEPSEPSCTRSFCYATYSARVTYLNANSKIVAPGETAQLGTLTLFFGGVVRRVEVCDSVQDPAWLAGFARP